LVEVAPTARPPVCKLMDFGKFKYESALKARESRKNQAQTVIKEIKIRPKIDPHDYGTKKGHVERFLRQGDKVKVTIMFRGREQSRPELGYKLLQRLAGDVEELGFVESQPKQDGRNMIMVIGPHRKKTDVKAVRGPDRASARAAAPAASADGAGPAARRASTPASTPDTVASGEPAAASPQPVSQRPSAAQAAAAPRPTAPKPAAPRPGPPRSAAGSGARPAAPAAADSGVSAAKPATAGSGAPKPAPPKPGPAGASGPRPAPPKSAARLSAPRSTAAQSEDAGSVPSARSRAAGNGAANAEAGG
jgi:translation initiation factor IF-3